MEEGRRKKEEEGEASIYSPRNHVSRKQWISLNERNSQRHEYI
jgi:hypothetical protein